MSTNRRFRESPAETPAPSDAPTSYKGDGTEDRGNATETKTVEGGPGQEGPRHTENRGSIYTSRSHKSISRLTDSPLRIDSRGQIYKSMAACKGQFHE